MHVKIKFVKKLDFSSKSIREFFFVHVCFSVFVHVNCATDPNRRNKAEFLRRLVWTVHCKSERSVLALKIEPLR